MKKIVVFTVVMAMLFQMGALVLVNAADRIYNQSLITHWDFDGEQPYEDKASGGKKSDVLTVHGNDIALDKGVAYIPNTAGTYLSAAGTSDTDLYGFKNKTVVVKAAFMNNASSIMLTSMYLKESLLLLKWNLTV